MKLLNYKIELRNIVIYFYLINFIKNFETYIIIIIIYQKNILI